jgi:uncharacterized Zn finger protein (UPF0148 family)
VALLRARRRAAGQCLQCGHPSAGASRCPVCKVRRKGWERHYSEALTREEAILERSKKALNRQLLRLQGAYPGSMWATRQQAIARANPQGVHVGALCNRLHEKSRSWAALVVQGAPLS